MDVRKAVDDRAMGVRELLSYVEELEDVIKGLRLDIAAHELLNRTLVEELTVAPGSIECTCDRCGDIHHRRPE